MTPVPRRDAARRRTRWAVVVGAVCWAIAIPVVALTVGELRNELALRRAGVAVCATVTAHDLAVDKRGVDYLVTYRFVVGGVPYTASDGAGDANMWRSVPEDEGVRSEQSGCVHILYLADRPQVNRPVGWQGMGAPVGSHIAALVIAALVVALWLWLLVAMVRVARTRLWRVVEVSPDGQIELVSVDERDRRCVPRVDVARAVVVPLPEARIQAPWRFETDVLRLELTRGETVVIEIEPTPVAAALVEELIRRK